MVQTHFSAANNVGDVAAKEEVWEVAAQMVGLAASVALLSMLDAMGTPEAVVPAWAAVHAAHVALRYYALTVLRFPFANLKRGAALVGEHVAHGRVLGVDEANAAEDILAGPAAGGIACVFGCSAQDAVGADGGRGGEPHVDLPALLRLYEGERYVLTRRNGTAYVLLWEEARGEDMLRALWQAAWLQRSGGAASLAADADRLHESLEAVRREFPGLQKEAERVGWQFHKTVLPTGTFRLATPINSQPPAT